MSTEPLVLDLRRGALISCGGKEYLVTGVAQLDTLLARDVETGAFETLPIADVGPPLMKTEDEPGKSADRDLEELSADDIATAKARLAMITPLLKPQQRGSQLAEKIGKENDVHFTTLYRWRRGYLATGLLSSLLPGRPNGGKGKSRLKTGNKDELMQKAIDEHYLTTSKFSVKGTWDELKKLCRAAGVATPSISTLRRRIRWHSQRAVVAARQGERTAILMFDANEGQIPDALWPLAMVQVDHTELPVMIVDEINRRPINRPWVTFAIDVNSRVIPGMHLSLDHPSAMSAGMCIAHAILPKEKWLSDRDIKAEWPCWGVMGNLHMDNAREFRGAMLKAACEEYLIDIHLRPVKKPHYGAHIERLMGTVSEQLKRVPGTTFSGPKEKGEYDSEGNAIMTLAELEHWLAYFIAKYHHDVHSSIGMSPLQKYREGLLGTKKTPGRGLPARRLDEEKVRIDFMPFEERTIQDYGVLWDVHYFSDTLRRWINVMDPDNPRAKRTFRFRRDPRDISTLYFFDPEIKRYFPVPYRDLTYPPISIWEFREAKRAAKKAGMREIDEPVIFEYVEKMRQEVAQSAEKTKTARRKRQKNIEHAKARERRKTELPTVSASPTPTAPPPSIPGYDPEAVTPFDEA